MESFGGMFTNSSHLIVAAYSWVPSSRAGFLCVLQSGSIHYFQHLCNVIVSVFNDITLTVPNLETSVCSIPAPLHAFHAFNDWLYFVHLCQCTCWSIFKTTYPTIVFIAIVPDWHQLPGTDFLFGFFFKHRGTIDTSDFDSLACRWKLEYLSRKGGSM